MSFMQTSLHNSEATLRSLLVPAKLLRESGSSWYVPNNDPCNLDCSKKILMPRSLQRLLSVCRRVQLWHMSLGDGNRQAGDRHQQQRGEEEPTSLGKADDMNESLVGAVCCAVASIGQTGSFEANTSLFARLLREPMATHAVAY
jgi:hypothetical protein